MHETKRISLDKFRRKPAADHPPDLPAALDTTVEVRSTSTEPERSQEWWNVENAVRNVLMARWEAALKASAKAEDPRDKNWVRSLPNLSVNDICRAAGRSRSAVYEYHQDFVRDAQAAKEEVERALNERMRSFKPTTKTSLRERLKEVEAELERERALRASESLTMLIERIGPAMKERSSLVSEITRLQNKVSDLEADVQRLREQNRALSITLTERLNMTGSDE